MYAAHNGGPRRESPTSSTQKGVPSRESPSRGAQKAGPALDYGDVSAYELAPDGHVRGGAHENDGENADSWCDEELPMSRLLLRACYLRVLNYLQWGVEHGCFFPSNPGTLPPLMTYWLKAGLYRLNKVSQCKHSAWALVVISAFGPLY